MSFSLMTFCSLSFTTTNPNAYSMILEDFRKHPEENITQLEYFTTQKVVNSRAYTQYKNCSMVLIVLHRFRFISFLL
ncbi:MAG: hypothetical protein JWM14_1174 [Chitinophagaceae bacterium]|nr:hypothetical protein [Chitinophagaceae bacterium]